VIVHKPIEESTVTATVKTVSENEEQITPSLEVSKIMEIKQLLAGVSNLDSRPTLDNNGNANTLEVSQNPAEVSLLRSTINTMKKQGYFLAKNQDYIKQENLGLKETNAKLEQLVTSMEQKMEIMVKETNEARNKCEKVLFNSIVHESLLIERIDGLQKLNK